MKFLSKKAKNIEQLYELILKGEIEFQPRMLQNAMLAMEKIQEPTPKKPRRRKGEKDNDEENNDTNPDEDEEQENKRQKIPLKKKATTKTHQIRAVVVSLSNLTKSQQNQEIHNSAFYKNIKKKETRILGHIEGLLKLLRNIDEVDEPDVDNEYKEETKDDDIDEASANTSSSEEKDNDDNDDDDDDDDSDDDDNDNTSSESSNDESTGKAEGNGGVNDEGADLPTFAAAVAAEAQATTSLNDKSAGKFSNLSIYSSLYIYIYIYYHEIS